MAARPIRVLALLALTATVCGRQSDAAETVTSALVSEPSVVVQRSVLFAPTATQLIALPNGTHLAGNELTLACVEQTTAVEMLLLYGLHSRRCNGLSEAAPRLGLTFATLDVPLPSSLELLVVVPPGAASVGGLEDKIFVDGFE